MQSSPWPRSPLLLPPVILTHTNSSFLLTSCSFILILSVSISEEGKHNENKGLVKAVPHGIMTGTSGRVNVPCQSKREPGTSGCGREKKTGCSQMSPSDANISPHRRYHYAHAAGKQVSRPRPSQFPAERQKASGEKPAGRPEHLAETTRSRHL